VKKLLTFLVGAVFIALATEQVAQAAVLGTEDFTISGGISDIFTEFKPTLALAPASVGPGPNASAPMKNSDILDEPLNNPLVGSLDTNADEGSSKMSGFIVTPATNAPLFVGTSITAADVGRTFTATQESDPNFNEFAALLTNGKSNKVTLSFGSGKLGSGDLFLTKSGRLFVQNTGFFGTTIDSVSLRVDSLTLNSPGVNPNGNGDWTDYSFSGVAIVDGEPVPEPVSALSTLAFGLGVIGLGFAHKRQKRSGNICPF